MTAEEFCEHVIGKPWINRAEGPNAYDCWGLVLASFREIDGIELPQVPGYADSGCSTEIAAKQVNMNDFPRSQPCDGAIMAVFNTKMEIIHIGRCLCGRVIHATSALGVRSDSYKCIINKYPRVGFFRYAPNNTHN
jgi:hypothetical protein